MNLYTLCAERNVFPLNTISPELKYTDKIKGAILAPDKEPFARN